jgi:hypothetical protein
LALRLALAAVLTLAMLVAFASVGGLGQAGANTRDFGSAVGSMFLTSGSGTGEDDDDDGDDLPGEDQYCEEDDDGGGGGDDDGGGGGDDDGRGVGGGDDDGGGGGDDDGGGGGDDECDDEDEDPGGEDECAEREDDLRAHQAQETAALQEHQTSPHLGLFGEVLQLHFQQEQLVLDAHQAQENRELDDDCGEG